MKAVAVTPGETTVRFPVTERWGPGAYVVASAIRPLGTAPAREPVRSLGVAHAPVDPGARRLALQLEAPEAARPGDTLTARLAIDGLAPGTRAYATVAAVDAGILGLTGFTPPAPDDWAFGQRRLGARLHDLYGALIVPEGSPGRLRSGGDAAGTRVSGAPPEGPLVAAFSGLVETDANGTATISFALPDYTGAVRLMAVAWTAEGLGHASRDVLVRDPVAARFSAPRFLAPGDSAAVVLELAHVTGPAGEVAVTLGAEGGLRLDAPSTHRIALAPSARHALTLPVTAMRPGTGHIEARLLLPGGEAQVKRLALPLRETASPIRRRETALLQPGESRVIGVQALDGLTLGSVEAALSLGPLAAVDAAGLLAQLAAYPHACTEQTISGALPLVALGDAVLNALPASAGPADQLIAEAIAGVLANQAGHGGFGLWRPGHDSLWLDAYATDFLLRARRAGHAVPSLALQAAIDNLRNRLGYEADFERGGEGLAYALYVLAREGRAEIGTLRYYADERGTAFATPMARAQLGAALAFYGESRRADAMFRLATDALDRSGQGWREDFGTARRDRAALAALAAEAGSAAVDPMALLAGLDGSESPLSTQEMAWTLLAVGATHGMAADAATVAGRPAAAAAMALPAASVGVANTGDSALPVAFSASGTPAVALPPDGNGLSVERRHFDLDGNAVDLGAVPRGARIVTVLTIRQTRPVEGRLILRDPLPAGFEIENPRLLGGDDLAALAWLDLDADAAHADFGSEAFVAALDWRNRGAQTLAYIARAVSQGRFAHPAPAIEDMYRPSVFARGPSGTVVIE
jgi:uncharacterized protein YfaS (alpha-2-macroglobulin family)